ncbi:MAG: hypothetical protein DHS20C15_23710 [Planctomycetota bacterium]|nr:MAG: hypothetical protein DHS20C15_23710 [Planctomycetota bacterium]
MRRALLFAACFAGLGACAIEHRIAGRALPSASELSALQPGVSTLPDALELLGAPASLRRTFSGDLYVWRRSESHSSRLLLIPLFAIYENSQGEGGSDRLALLFDTQGVLLSFGLREETRSAREREEAASEP